MRTFLTMLLCFLFSVPLKMNAQQAEEDAIKKVIAQETSSFFHKDCGKWAETWLKDSAAYVWRAGPSGQYKLMGWNAIASAYKQSKTDMSVMDEAAIAPFMNKADYHIYINGNMAAVTFKETKCLVLNQEPL